MIRIYGKDSLHNLLCAVTKLWLEPGLLLNWQTGGFTLAAVTQGKVRTNIYEATRDFLLHNNANTS